MRHVAATFGFLACFACATPIAYVPQPNLIENPQSNFDRLVAKLHDPAPYKIDYGDGYARLAWYTGDGDVVVKVIQFCDFHSGEMFSYRGGYAVVIKDDSGEQVVGIETDTQAEAQEFIDTMSALRNKTTLCAKQ